MKRIASLLVSLACLSVGSLMAADQPHGSLIEVHSCQLYAGGCVVSSEATLGGRYMIRAWNIAGGTFAGADLTGLQLAVLQASSDNLAAPGTDPGEAVVYLPQAASTTQRDALLAWLKATVTDLKGAPLHTRVAPLLFAKTDTGYAFSAGNAISVRTAPFQACETGACGEALWYQPRTPNSTFNVAVARSCRVAEPLLKLHWEDQGKRSLFVGQFGGANAGQWADAALATLCGIR